MSAWKNRQQGIGTAGIIVIIAVVIFAAILAMKIVPAYLQSMDIQHLFKIIASDPEMKNATVKDVRDSYVKRATMDSVSAISAEDVQIDKSDGNLVLSASYSVKIPVAGNASLVLEFNPTSAK